MTDTEWQQLMAQSPEKGRRALIDQYSGLVYAIVYSKLQGLGSREDVEDWKTNKDPIKRFRDYLIKKKLATKKELDEIDAAAAKKMEAAVEFALNSPDPDPAHVMDDVFYEG